ncbi:MAG: hypothetical protein HWE20_12865 [Gammaproteobacteria bacterium]|nr:hypothetical protein [Gammaproteobacteria bacterium]
MFKTLTIKTLIAAALTAQVGHAQVANIMPDPTYAEWASSLNPDSVETAYISNADGQLVEVKYAQVGEDSLLQGDILIDSSTKNGRTALVFDSRHWTSGTIPFYFDSAVPGSVKDNFRKATQNWANATGLVFEELSAKSGDYLHVQPGNGCASYVGKQGGGQTLRLSSQCSVGNIIHEIGHALGLFHHHTRSDRSGYVKINFAKVRSGYSHNFEVVNLTGTKDIGRYDYGSIMHYNAYAFSDGTGPTIEVLGSGNIGQRSALSTSDIEAIRALYATDIKVETGIDSSTINTGDDTAFWVRMSNTSSYGANGLSIEMELPDGVMIKQFGDASLTCEDLSFSRCYFPALRPGQTVKITGTLVATHPSNQQIAVNVVPDNRDYETLNNDSTIAFEARGAVVTDVEPVTQAINNIAGKPVSMDTGKTSNNFASSTSAATQSNDAGGGGAISTLYALILLSLKRSRGHSPGRSRGHSPGRSRGRKLAAAVLVASALASCQSGDDNQVLAVNTQSNLPAPGSTGTLSDDIEGSNTSQSALPSTPLGSIIDETELNDAYVPLHSPLALSEDAQVRVQQLTAAGWQTLDGASATVADNRLRLTGLPTDPDVIIRLSVNQNGQKLGKVAPVENLTDRVAIFPVEVALYLNTLWQAQSGGFREYDILSSLDHAAQRLLRKETNADGVISRHDIFAIDGAYNINQVLREPAAFTTFTEDLAAAKPMTASLGHVLKSHYDALTTEFYPVHIDVNGDKLFVASNAYRLTTIQSDPILGMYIVADHDGFDGDAKSTHTNMHANDGHLFGFSATADAVLYAFTETGTLEQKATLANPLTTDPTLEATDFQISDGLWYNDHLYVTDNRRLYVFALVGDTLSQVGDSIDVGRGIYNLTLSDGQLFVSSLFTGTASYDLSSISPVKISDVYTHLDSNISASAIDVEGDFVVVGDYGKGRAEWFKRSEQNGDVVWQAWGSYEDHDYGDVLNSVSVYENRAVVSTFNYDSFTGWLTLIDLESGQVQARHQVDSLISDIEFDQGYVYYADFYNKVVRFQFADFQLANSTSKWNPSGLTQNIQVSSIQQSGGQLVVTGSVDYRGQTYGAMVPINMQAPTANAQETQWMNIVPTQVSTVPLDGGDATLFFSGNSLALGANEQPTATDFALQAVYRVGEQFVWVSESNGVFITSELSPPNRQSTPVLSDTHIALSAIDGQRLAIATDTEVALYDIQDNALNLIGRVGTRLPVDGLVLDDARMVLLDSTRGALLYSIAGGGFSLQANIPPTLFFDAAALQGNHLILGDESGAIAFYDVERLDAPALKGFQETPDRVSYLTIIDSQVYAAIDGWGVYQFPLY